MARMQTKGLPASSMLRIDAFKGMNLSVTPTQIDQSQSPDMLNMNIDERGALNQRTGYERIFNQSLGNGMIQGLFHYERQDGEDFLFVHNQKLMKTDAIPSKEYRREATWEDDDLDATWED